MNDLSILIPDENIELRETKVILKPCKLKDLKKALAIVSKYIDKIAEAEDSMILTKQILGDSGEEALTDIVSILEVCSDKSKEFFDELYYDELSLLVVKFIEQNKDFFTKMGNRLNPPKEESQQPEVKTGVSTLAA